MTVNVALRLEAVSWPIIGKFWVQADSDRSCLSAGLPIVVQVVNFVHLRVQGHPVDFTSIQR